MAPATRSGPAWEPSIPSALAGKSILIVEDEPLVALEVHGALSAAGASIISAATASEAIRLIGYAEISAALVDVQLGNENAARVCELLARRQIPFVFYTGRAEKTLFAHWPGVRVLTKPGSSEDIIAVLAAALRKPAP
jgi:CheY-like chemotaxis protein